MKGIPKFLSEVKLTFDDGTQLRAKLYDTECARGIYETLPVEAEINKWGDEFYFSIPYKYDPDETATEDVDIGDIGWWPPGNAIAIFFGPTPISRDEKPKPASSVNLIGKLIDDPKVLKKVRSKRIRIIK
ncbi:MAG: cyclophilin-like fold protein [Thermosulfidibacteraceae bacterium]